MCNLILVTPLIGGREAHHPAPDQVPGSKVISVCPHFHAAVELIGKRWAGVILWALIDRPAYFSELRAAIPAMSDRLLSRRLRELEAEGLVERVVHPGTPARVSYALTEVGHQLEPAMRELHRWARLRNGATASAE